MSILNVANDGLLSVLQVLRRALLVYGAMPADRLFALCAPEGAVKADSGAKAKETLTTWTHLGMFLRDGETVRLTEDFRRIPSDDIEGVRSAVLRLLLRPENNRTIDGVTSKEVNEGPWASDFTRAAAWSLSQDPFRLTAIDDVVHMANEQRVTPVVFTNDTRWPSFKTWAHFTGLAMPLVRNRFLFNPARAVRGVLDTVWSGSARLAIHEFLDELCLAIPILERGAYASILARQVEKPWRTLGQNEISPCLSLAFLQLRHELRFRFENLADSPRRMTLLGRNGRILESVTHVVREQA